MPQTTRYNADAARFGAILQRLREERGWTKKKLGTRAGLTPTYIGILEQGGNVPSLSTVLELAEVLGADIAEIMRALSAARNSPPPAKTSAKASAAEEAESRTPASSTG